MHEDKNKEEEDKYFWWSEPGDDKDGDGIFENVAKSSLTLGFIGA